MRRSPVPAGASILTWKTASPPACGTDANLPDGRVRRRVPSRRRDRLERPLAKPAILADRLDGHLTDHGKQEAPGPGDRPGGRVGAGHNPVDVLEATGARSIRNPANTNAP